MSYGKARQAAVAKQIAMKLGCYKKMLRVNIRQGRAYKKKGGLYKRGYKRKKRDKIKRNWGKEKRYSKILESCRALLTIRKAELTAGVVEKMGKKPPQERKVALLYIETFLADT